MEPGETTEDAARREVLEETGLTLGTLSFFGVFSGPEMFVRYPNGDEVHMVVIVYTSREYSGRLQGDAEVADLRFLDPTALPDSIGSSVAPVLQRYLETIMGA